MFVQPVNASELLQLIAKLKNDKAPGFDQIGPSLVKEISPVICEPLLHIFNLSFSTGDAEQNWQADVSMSTNRQ